MNFSILPLTDEAIAEALTVLRSGGSVVYPTETCYGLACDLTDRIAVERVFALKARPANMPVSALFPSIEAAKAYTQWTTEAEKIAKAHLPGPLTLILRIRPDAPKKIYPTPSGGETLGVRISSHPVAQALAAGIGGHPLSTTSANIHGKDAPYTLEEIRAQFQNEGLRPELILDGGTLPRKPPSTVIDLTNGEHVIRKGDVLLS